MRKRVVQIAKHPLITGSAIMVIGSLAGNVFNLLFNVYMVRSLSVVDYGILASLNSLITLPSLAAGAIIPTIIRFAGEYFAKNNTNQASGLFFKMSKYFAILGFIILILFLIFAHQIGIFLKIKDTFLIIISGVIVFFGFMGAVNTAFLQAKLEFKFMVGINFFGSFSKLLLGIGLVSSGYSVAGAIWAYLLSYISPYLLTFIPLRSLFHKTIIRVDTHMKELIAYGFPAALCMLSLTSFITTDILLVKHFFSPHDAGIYASLSLIGRIIYFISAPITSVMFPLVIQRYSRNEKYNHFFFFSLFLVLLPSVVITLFYFLFPTIILQVFFKESQPVQDLWLLGYIGIFITLYSIVFLITNFFLSIKKTIIAIPLSLAALLQIGCIWIFHNSFYEVITYSSYVLCLLLFVLLLYYLITQRGNKNHDT